MNKLLLISVGPLPRFTSLDLDSDIYRSIERILSAFDDAMQVGLVKLRTTEIKSLGSQLAVAN